MRENGIKGYNETTGTGEVRHLAARKIENAVTVTAVANGNFTKRLAPFEQKLKELYGENFHVFNSVLFKHKSSRLHSFRFDFYRGN